MVRLLAVSPAMSARSSDLLHGTAGSGDELALVGVAVVLGLIVLWLSRGGKGDDA